MKDIPKRLCAGPVAREGGAKQEGEVDAREVELVAGSQRGREHERSDESAGESAPDAHRALASETASAALTNEVGQALREISEKGTACRLYLLRIQPHVVGEPHELIHQLDRILNPAGASERLGEPERTRQKRAPRSLEAVLTAVAAHERPVPELAAHRFDRPSPAAFR